MTRSGQTYYYITNGHGDIVGLTNQAGQIVNSYRHDPWGNLLESTETVVNPYRYAGYRYDTPTGLYYLWNRYYSPNVRRFLTEDRDPGSVLRPMTQNPYVYCLQDPVSRIDSDGMYAVPVDPTLPVIIVPPHQPAEWEKEAARDAERAWNDFWTGVGNDIADAYFWVKDKYYYPEDEACKPPGREYTDEQIWNLGQRLRREGHSPGTKAAWEEFKRRAKPADWKVWKDLGLKNKEGRKRD